MIIKVEHGRYNLFLDPDGASGGRIKIAGSYKNCIKSISAVVGRSTSGYCAGMVVCGGVGGV